MILTTLATGAAATAVGKAAFKGVVDEACKQLKGFAGRKISQWNTEAKISQLYTKIAKVRKVKTLWQIDKAVDLASFYCPSHAMIKKHRKHVKCLDDIDVDEHILIQGIAGQGKSMLMRYLCAVELARGKYIPVFVELRRVQDARTLRSEIYASLKALEFDVDDSLFTALCKSGKILLLLDGFDEVAESHVQRIISELEDLALTQDQLKIVVSSRPDSGLEMSSHFQVVKLDDLRNDEYKAVVHRLLEDEETAEDIIDQVEAHEGLIKGCLSTPLMVTMLVVIYKSYAAIPAQFSEFYDSLFKVLLQRHDGVKPGYRRHRRCTINDTDYRHGFEVLCLSTKKIKSSLFSEADLLKCATETLKICKIDQDPEKFVADIIKITCLLVKEGGRCRFVHKSVQEYYAASMIRRKPDKFIEDFYSSFLIGGNVKLRAWQQELAFLSEIDTYRYNRFYMLPLTIRFLEGKGPELPDSAPVADLAMVTRIIGNITIGLDTLGGVSTPMVAYNVNSDVLARRLITSFWTLDCGKVIAAIKSGGLKSVTVVSDTDKPGWVRIPVGVILEHGFLCDEFTALVNKRLREFFRQGQTIQRALLDLESDNLLKAVLED